MLSIIHTSKFLNFYETNGWSFASRNNKQELFTGKINAVKILSSYDDSDGFGLLKYVLVKQFRPPVNDYVIELPAGLVDEGETPEQAAIREMKEETGLHFIPLGYYDSLSSPGLTDELCRTYYGAAKGTPLTIGGIEKESIEVIIDSLDNIQIQLFHSKFVAADVRSYFLNRTK